MRISYNWLKEYVEFDLSPQQVADRLTMAGLEVEGLEYLGEGIEGVIVGRIASIKPHPDADRLTVCDVETGSEVLPIVCGAKNMKEGDKAPLAIAGAKLPGGVKISKGKLRGVVSYGMLCSEKELGLAKESSGLMILPAETPVGESIQKAIGLDDWALEINVTPNRPDCLSVIGIAREVSALLRKPLMLPQVKVDEKGSPVGEMIKIEITDPGLCLRYAGRAIVGVSIGPSPLWMQRRLSAVGVRPINNVVDITNYVMMETGQPLHAFDYDLVQDKKIIVRAAAEGERFTTLDGVERTLTPDMLLICDGVRPVALAGVMGGQNSEVTDLTKDIFLESAYFNPSTVRRASKKLGLHTEASHRFERGTDPEGVLAAADRAAQLMAELANGKVARGRADEYPAPVAMPTITVRAERVSDVLGAKLDKEEMADILKRLQLSVRDDGNGKMTVTAPAFRPDLTREADIIEEVARVHGYSRIRSTMPAYSVSPGAPDPVRDASDSVRKSLRDAGYSEVINFSFINPQDLGRLRLPEDDFRRRFISLRNPLTVEQSVMRTTLLPSLLGNLAWNFTRGERELKIFEISKVFLSEGPGLPEEPLKLGGLAVGGRTGTLWDGREGEVDFFDIKGAVEEVLGTLRVNGAVYRPAEEVPFLHPGKSAWLMVGGKQAGYLGQVHPDVMQAWDVPLDAFVFELDFDELVEEGGAEIKYSPLPKYPAVTRDIAAIVPAEVTSFAIAKAIESLKLGLVEDVRLFDYYAGKPIPEGKKSLAYSITYRSAERTLTDEEVNAVHQKVITALRERLGAEIREQ